MRVGLIVGVSAWLLSFSMTPLLAAWQVWTVSETRRVLREDPPEMRLAVELSAAGNEWESFQVQLRSDVPVSGIRLESGTFAAADGTAMPGARVVLYRQHQMQMTEPTYRNDKFRPGWYPDPLIPFVHPLTGKPLPDARLKAVPFDLQANETHGFWIDVYAPARTKAGVYQATFRVTASDQSAVTIPVSLRVWDFSLPETPTMQTSFGSPCERMRRYYGRAKAGVEKEPVDWPAVEKQCAQLLSEHRINATPSFSVRPEAQPDGSFCIPSEQIDELRQFVDARHINVYSIIHPRTAIKDPDQQRDRLHAWLDAWNRAAKELNRPQVTFCVYLTDEPNDEKAYRYVQQWGRAIRGARSVVKVMVTEQTLTQNKAWGDLNGAVDIWCPLFPLHDPETAAQRLAQGEKIWTYTALCQRNPTPWWQIDFPLLNYRVPSWIARRYEMCGLLYWGGMSFWQQVVDPWIDPKTLDRRKNGKGALYNGEGTLVYPGRAVGYDGIAPSLRLKALRDGIEDFEYLAILARAGQSEAARKIVLPLAESWFKWQPDPGAYVAARSQLARLIQDHKLETSLNATQ